MRAAFAAMGVEPPGLRLACANVIPHARGLGSSSAAIVAGLALARELVAGGRSLLADTDVFRLAAAIEGHPDNVAPAFFGGFVISGRDADGYYAVSSAVDPRIGAVVLVPPDPVSTELARRLLPVRVPHADAAADAGRAALLVAALAGQPEHLLLATRDYLHQEQRRAAMPASLDLVDALRADGVPAVISGAGPTVLAFTTAADEAESLLARCPAGWTGHGLAIDIHGVLVA
jgi:homoserine kinase